MLRAQARRVLRQSSHLPRATWARKCNTSLDITLRCIHIQTKADTRQESTSNNGMDNVAPQQMISVIYRGAELKVRKGSRLRTALLKGGLSPHNGDAKLINCRGLGTCGTCAVNIRGPVDPEQWNKAEQLRLNFPPHGAPGNQRLRLACQVQVTGDCEVTKFNGFWGQGADPLEPLQPGTSDQAGGDAQGQQAEEKTGGAGGVRGEGPPPGAPSAGPAAVPEPKSRLGLGSMPLGALEFLMDPDARKP